jgi:hypothetical protein
VGTLAAFFALFILFPGNFFAALAISNSIDVNATNS